MNGIAAFDARRARRAGRPLVLGHRGAMAKAPQNTLPAFLAARTDGADGVELDAQLSADGRLAVFHDELLDGLTDGAGRLAEKTWAQLSRLDAGIRFGADWAGTRIPLLEEVFAALDGEAFVNVELKYPDDALAGLEETAPDSPEAKEARRAALPLARAALACIGEACAADRVIVSSFNRVALELVRGLAPGLAIGWLREAGRTGPESERTRLFGSIVSPSGFDAYHPDWPSVDAALVEREHRAGRRVHVWTVDGAERIRGLAALGADALISNDPGAALAALGRAAPSAADGAGV